MIALDEAREVLLDLALVGERGRGGSYAGARERAEAQAARMEEAIRAVVRDEVAENAFVMHGGEVGFR